MLCQLTEARLVKASDFERGLFLRYEVLVNNLKSKRKSECSEALQYLSNFIMSA